jgi:hypothetical protein
VHGPLLLMQLPLSSYDAYTHIFFASHYAQHWFSPWNEKWFAGFSQTTYPPLVHQWIALFSHVMGLPLAYMFVQLAGILLLVVGVYRFARLWVGDRAASYAAVGAIFLGSLAMLVYQAGQLPTTVSAALLLNAVPYFYQWMRRASLPAFFKGVALAVAAAAAHHVTLLFGTVLFFLPVVWLGILDRNRADAEETSVVGVIWRAAMYGVVTGLLILFVLAPYWIALRQNPITQIPIPHGSRDNYILNPVSGINFWIIPMGALILALPWILLRGVRERRLRPLFAAWYVTTLLGLGGTTPVARLLLGRAFEVLTFERFTFWATLLALPIVAAVADDLVVRYRARATIPLWVAAVATFSMAVGWTVFRPINGSPFKVDEIINFLNRDEHSKFRYLTLGFGYNFSKVSAAANANSIDGDYNSARLLPELTAYGSGQLYNSKYYGTAGMESLRAVLKHANQYGLKYIFVRDRFYEPLLAFAGWRPAETYDGGQVTLWAKEDVPPAHPIESASVPPAWQGIEWGLAPVGTSVLALVLVILLVERRRPQRTIEFPSRAQAEPAMREVNS